MCTLIVAWRAFEEAPVVVAANRDEALDRPSSPPARVEGDTAAVAPRDEEAGGTWLGYNAAGVLVGLSNRWVETELAGERSRGRLVLDLLAAASADDVASALEVAVEAETYEPFNLLAVDAETALVFEWDGTLHVDELSPGVHAVLNAGWDDRFVSVEGHEEAVADQVERARWIREALAVAPGEAVEAWTDRATAALADHDIGMCVHRDGYGTRSSSVVTLYADGRADYRFADGPPCETAFVTVEAQL